MWNHQGDNQYLAGGICGIGVASACKQAEIGDDPDGTNRAAGVVGQKYVTRWGDGVDHALTIVGYETASYSTWTATRYMANATRTSVAHGS